MSNPELTIRISVDTTNPAQFFACCGLLEVAHRRWPEAVVMGKFDSPRFNKSQFSIFSKCNLGNFKTRDIISTLLGCKRSSVDPYRPIMGSDGKPVKDAKKTKPVMLGEPVSLRLSWWLDELAGRQTSFKMWGAHQTSEGLIGDMAQAIRTDEMTDDTVLQSRTGMTGRIGLDTRSSWNTLDEGFSPNDQNMPVETFPATELLAAIGLQTFGPSPQDDGYIYACWSHPLPAPIARAVASGVVNLLGVTRYRFKVGARGKFKFFTKASLLERNTNG
jgi:hypothetical protein